MTELELFVDFYRNSERQGPGSKKDTLRALEFMNFPKQQYLEIADIGCGSGGQTITLAQNTNGKITAVDLFPEFLNELNERSEKFGLKEKIRTIEKSMEELPFRKEKFDILWSEGAIYNVGFEKGIKEWKDYLKTGGYLAVSEITWITSSRPKEIEDYWIQEYEEIDIASNKIKILEENGYTMTGYFYLSQNSWVENYYKPMAERFEAFLERHNHSQKAKEVVREHKKEIELYQAYKDYYSYGFYIAKKNH